MRELRAAFRPEFLNRVDDIVLFKPLRLEEITRIVRIQAGEIQKRLAERGMKLELTDKAADFIARTAFDPVYGARPLKRYLQREVETRVARSIIGGDIGEGDTVAVGVHDNELVVEKRSAKPAERPAQART